MRVGHLMFTSDNNYGQVTNLRYPRTFMDRPWSSYAAEYNGAEATYKETNCPKKERDSTIDLTSVADLLNHLSDDRFEVSDRHHNLQGSQLRQMPGHIYEKCNPDPCPSDSTVDNLLETLNDILTDAGNPNLKLCPA